jgi:CubicO group peptidase (beta-lactamase class C family)
MIRTLFGFGSLWVAWSSGWQNALAQETSIKSPAVQLAPSAAGLTPEKLAELDRWIEETRKAWEVPGLSLAIVTEDQVLLSKGYGVREAGQEATVDADTLFAIASNSKAMTAAAIAILVDEGKLKWDDRVQQFLPWLRLSDPLASNDLRIRDLLCHRSGLGTFSGDLLWWGTPYTPQQILERAVHLKPQFPFRANFGYSNLMYLAAGEVIATVSGKPWPHFIRERILTPLEMNRTVLSIRDLEAIGNVASPHKTFPDRSQPIPWMNWDAMAAAGGVISSSNDMGRWIQLQLREGKLTDGRTLFSEANAFEMWQPQTIIPVSKSRSARVPSTHFRAYGLGWSLADYQGHKLVGHSGGYDGMYSEVLMVPEKKIGVVVLTNSMTSIGTAITYQVIDAALGAPPRDWSEENFRLFQRSRADFASRIQKATQPAAENTAPSHPLQSYTGLFRCPMYGDAQVALVDGKLQLKLLPYPALVADLEHLHYDTFAIRWHQDFAWFESGSAHFVADAQGKFVQIKLDIPNDDLWFYELDLQRVK